MVTTTWPQQTGSPSPYNTHLEENDVDLRVLHASDQDGDQFGQVWLQGFLTDGMFRQWQPELAGFQRHIFIRILRWVCVWGKHREQCRKLGKNYCSLGYTSVLVTTLQSKDSIELLQRWSLNNNSILTTDESNTILYWQLSPSSLKPDWWLPINLNIFCGFLRLRHVPSKRDFSLTALTQNFK